MQAYWITFTDGSSACCEGQSRYDAKKIAEHFTGKKVAGPEWKDYEVVEIPYPALPIIWQFEHPITGKMPAFCGGKKECHGKSSCPGRYACSN